MKLYYFLSVVFSKTFITDVCKSDDDCASGCCAFNTGKCAGAIIALERDGGCGFGSGVPNDNAARAIGFTRGITSPSIGVTQPQGTPQQQTTQGNQDPELIRLTKEFDDAKKVFDDLSTQTKQAQESAIQLQSQGADENQVRLAFQKATDLDNQKDFAEAKFDKAKSALTSFKTSKK